MHVEEPMNCSPSLNNHHQSSMKREADPFQKIRTPIIIKRRRINFDRRNNIDRKNHFHGSKHYLSSNSPISSRQQNIQYRHNDRRHLPPQLNPRSENVRSQSSNKIRNESNAAPTSSSTCRHPWLQYRSQNDATSNGKIEDDDSHLPSFSTERPTSNKLMDLPRLDLENPDHVHKIIKRRKMISYGKNTVGYDEYVKKVPKHKRIPRRSDHPCTPDSTIDIPWKRFHGLVKAWRKALHMYDPPDLLPENETVQLQQSNKNTKTDSLHTANHNYNQSFQAVQESEIQRATQLGLQVKFSNRTSNFPPSSPSSTMVGELNRLEINIKGENDQKKQMHKEEKQTPGKAYTWYQSSDDECDMAIDNAGIMEDSDDDIL